MFFVFFTVVAFILWGILLATGYLTYLVRHSNHRNKHLPKKKQISVMAVMGSGGHTMEMLDLIKELGVEYTPRDYILAETDQLSEQKVLEFEKLRDLGSFTIQKIPRSREVGQSYLSSVSTTTVAFWFALKQVWDSNPDLVLLNGPGTCVPIAIAAALLDMIRIRDTVLIYEESICRVKQLSLSAAILYYSGLVDEVVVQWPELKSKYPRTTLIQDLPDVVEMVISDSELDSKNK
ncbi:unnamed protein product [Caenorhabditis auriculariae]|uniref:UDP-N-acetylglucosamine transferase subunit ALG14 n=1 Tax=Caenorhabditis auriculariae TaxID=2777116 RepID=A0A8S1HIY0_9PELO|nr:unnamed protein product [Caenorhabditis auriculariae]